MPIYDHPPEAAQQPFRLRKWLTSASPLLASALLGLIILRLADLGPWLQIIIVAISVIGSTLCVLALEYLHWTVRRALLTCVAPTAVIVTGIVIVAIVLSEPPDVRWYTLSRDGQAELAETDTLAVEDSWKVEAEARIPVRIAVENRGQKPLQDVTVQIGYPVGYEVIPQGNQRLDAEERLLIYEHPLEDLHVDGNYVMLLNPDELVLPTLTISWDKIFLSEERIPIELHGSIAYVGGKTDEVENCLFVKEIPLEFRLFSSGDLVAETTLKVVPDPDFSGFLKLDEIAGSTPISVEELNEGEKELLEHILGAQRSWDWSASFEGSGDAAPHWPAFDDGVMPLKFKISFEETNFGEAQFQVVAVDNFARKIIVDSNGDGRRDFEVIKTGINAEGQEIVRYDEADSPMNPWTPEKFESSRTWACQSPLTSLNITPGN
jgi:hypothetical protein